MSTPPQKEPQEGDLLVPFEIQNIPAEYREYYKIKRNNFFASVQGFPEMWKYYILLDKIWMREIDDLKPARDPNRMFPMMLFINAHAKIRVSIELAFSGCLAEARSILRDAIEFAAHGHRILTDSKLLKIWLGKNDSEAALNAFREAFEKQKKDRLFQGLDELREKWGELSETGSHAGISAMCDRFRQVKSADHIEFGLIYCGAESDFWEKSLFTMLLTCFTIEKLFFSDYGTRLNLDDGLVAMRSNFERFKEQLRRDLIARHQIKPPPPKSVIIKP